MKNFTAFSVLVTFLVTISFFTNFIEASSIVTTFDFTNLTAGAFYLNKQQLIVDPKTGFVYVGFCKWILQFDPDLTLIASVETIPPNFDTNCSKCRQHQQLVINRDFGELLACTSIQNHASIFELMIVNSTCTGWNLTNLSRLDRKYSSPISDSTEKLPWAFIAPGPSNAANTTNVLYVMSHRGLQPRKIPTFASRSLVPDDNMKLTSPANLDFEPEKTWEPVYGFSYNGFSYFLAKTYYGGLGFKLIRFCQNHSNLTSYADVPIKCAQERSKSEHGDDAAAYFGSPGSDIAEQLNTTTDDQVLFVAFAHSGEYRSNLCVYSMNKIRKAFLINKQASSSPEANYVQEEVAAFDEDFCKTASGPIRGYIPLKADPVITLNGRAHAVTETTSGASTLVFIGTVNGQIHKILLSTPTMASENSEPVKLGFRYGWIHEMVPDSDEQHLYVLHEGEGAPQLSKILLTNCSEFETLQRCVDAANRLCGWCPAQNRCTSSQKCSELQTLKHDDGKLWISCAAQSHFNSTRSERIFLDYDKRTSEPGPVNLTVPVGLHLNCYKIVNQTIIYEATSFAFDTANDTCAADFESGSVKCTLQSLAVPPRDMFLSENMFSFILTLTLKRRKFSPLISLERIVVVYSLAFSDSYRKCLALMPPHGWNRKNRFCERDPPALPFDLNISEDPSPAELHQSYHLTCKIESSRLGSVFWTKDGLKLTPASLESNGIANSTEIGWQGYDAQFHNLEFESLQSKHLGEYTCRFSDGNNTISETFNVSAIHVGPSLYDYQDLDYLELNLLTWCDDSKFCSLQTSAGVLDSSWNIFGFYGIMMNPLALEFFNSTNSTIPSISKLPETISMRNAKRAIIRADPSDNQVLWTHTPGGHLWLTNVDTGASVVLEKDFGVVNMEVDWENGIVFGVSEKDRKCIFKLNLQNTSSVSRIFVGEEITAIAVGQRGLIYYGTASGKIVQRNRDGAEVEVFRGHQNSLPKSLIVRRDGKLSWIQDFFGKYSVIYTLQPQNASGVQRISRHAIKKVIKGIQKMTEVTSRCPKCSHFCEPSGLQPSCDCQYKLRKNGTTCRGKWIHAVTKSDLLTFDMERTKEVLHRRSLNSTQQLNVFPQDGLGNKTCFLNKPGDFQTTLVCWNATHNLPVGSHHVLEVRKDLCSADVDVIFVNGSCIQIFHIEKNKSWTLFCGRISLTNVAVDTKSWTVFWEHNKEKSVHMTKLDSMVTRRIINAATFELQTEVPGRLALDSNSNVLYWIHGSKVWSRSYRDVANSKPKYLWDTGNPKQLQFHDGFLYWIESKDGDSDEIVIFDVHHESKQTLISALDDATRFESFAVQSDEPQASPNSEQCSECEHFCRLNQRNGISYSECWCPNEKPILASNGSCHEPALYVVHEIAPKTFDLSKTTRGTLRHNTANLSAEALEGSTVFAASKNVQCWLGDQKNQMQCWNLETNNSIFVGPLHSTNPVFSLDFSEDLVIFNTGNETRKYGSFTLGNITNGEKLEFEPIRETRGSPFAFDHRRKLAVWCTDRELRFHEVGGCHLNSHEASIVEDFQDAKRCSSLTLDEENDRAYFIYGQKIKCVKYIPKRFTPPVTTLYEMSYSYANSLSFDGNGHLFWAGGFSDFGEFVDMIKIPEKEDEMVASIRVLKSGKYKIVQVQADREVHRNFTKNPANSRVPCDTLTCEYFCFPEHRWTLRGTKCFCPTTYSSEGGTNSNCDPLYGNVISDNRGETFTRIVKEDNDESLMIIIIGSCAGVVVVALIFFGIIIRKRRGDQEEDYQKALAVFLEGDQDSAKMIKNLAERSYYVPFSKTIPPEDIDLTDAKQLGTGQFGAVFLAKYKEESVAIKIVKHGSDKEQMKEFLKEIKIMAYIGDHAHIVQMYGAEISNLEKGGVLVVLELCPHGDLETFLRKHKNNLNYIDTCVEDETDNNKETTSTNFTNLVAWSRQIADGLAYLEEKQVVHGDLATRNVLLFDNNVVKVSDFGFSRKTYGKQYTKSNKQTPLPFRWAAPETLDQMVFSTQSDVWSYGVTVWEIFTLGNCPFAQQSWDLTFSTRLREGMRLEKPELATDKIYNRLMMHCWEINPDDRPTFVEICEFWAHL